MILETYDIFSGSPEKDPLWLESVTGLEAASTRMQDRARQKPGPYFVYCVHTQQILASTDASAANLPARAEQLHFGRAQKA